MNYKFNTMKKATILIFILFTSFVLKAQMILEYNTNLSAGTEITIPLDGTTATVDWGDGSTPEDFNSPTNISHTYATDGIYTVSITGNVAHYGSYMVDNNKLTKVLDFGDIGITDFSYAFVNGINLTEVPTSLPNNVYDLRYMFDRASSFNQDISNWDLSSVTTTKCMFINASIFNQDISGWEVSSVTDMYGMFQGASNFNHNISNWNVSNVTGMYRMFYNAISFDKNIGNWDVSNVTDMTDMFLGVTLSTANYDSILIVWANQTLQTDVVFGAGNSKYSCNSETARNTLTSSPNNWIITDGGSAGNTSIVTQPTPTQIITEGNDANFLITAQGVNLSYQWKKNGVDLSNGVNISGSLTNELLITSVSVSDEGTYTCAVTGDCGNITSDNAVLEVQSQGFTFLFL